MSQLKTMRTLLGLSQQEVANKLKTSQANICQMERKGIYDTRVANKYGKALGCNPIFLLEEISKY